MTLKEAWFGVAIALTVVAAIVLVYRLFRPQAAETQASKIEEMRRDNPLPVNEDLSKFAKTVRTVTIKKPVAVSPPGSPDDGCARRAPGRGGDAAAARSEAGREPDPTHTPAAASGAKR